uniref:Reverse transcriptase zinc-binding domain-containing protein n=1 Tax=Manihot esculenta TaxID=3983 RepID=A0A2C9UUU6_MANES
MCDSKARGGLGFKDVEAFNMSLLAKQAWRMLHNPKFLVAQILKGKYFPASSFLNAKHLIDHPASHSWRTDVVKGEREDRFIWHYTSHGLYSVKTGYCLARNLKLASQSDQEQAGPSSTVLMTSWKHIWKLQVPSNLTIFLWLLFKNRLPTNANIHSKIKNIDPLYFLWS